MTNEARSAIMQKHAGHSVEIVEYYAGSDDPEYQPE